MRFTLRNNESKAFLLIVLFAITTSLLSAQSICWKLIDAKIQREFPQVARITTSKLAALLEKGETPVLFDVRTKAEFEVSHLPGAIRIEPNSDPHMVSLPKSKAMITCCSVGYRSAALAKKLRYDGYSDVTNLEGSLFRWANENRSLVHDNGEPTDKVHPYDALWGKLLDPKRRAENPPAPKRTKDDG